MDVAPTRSDVGHPAIVDALHRLEAEAETEGWDIPASVFTISWLDRLDPHHLAELDQDLAELRDKTGETPKASVLAVDHFATIDGHPYQALLGQRFDADVDVVVLRFEGWVALTNGGTDLRPPSERDDRVECRFLIAMDRSGATRQIRRARGSDEVIDDEGMAAGGRVADVLRRSLGIPTPPPEGPPTWVLGRMWLLAAYNEAGPSSQVAASTDPGVHLDGYELCWGDVAHLARMGAFSSEVASPDLAAWMDEGILSRVLDERVPAQADLVAGLRREGRGQLADTICAAIHERGWGDPQRGPGPKPGRVGRNEPCPCGSGRKFKACHGRPAPHLA